MTVQPKEPQGGLTAAEAALVAALVDRYAAAREQQRSAAVAVLVWLWRSFLTLGSGRTVRDTAEARLVAVARNLPVREFARSLPADALGVLYDEGAVAELSWTLARESGVAQRQAAALAGEFERQVLDVFQVPSRARVTGPTANTPDVAVPGSSPAATASDVVSSRSDVDPVIVYERPVIKYRYERSTDRAVEDALADAEERLKRLVEDDLLVAERDAFEDIINGPDTSTITGYRRVIRPELSRDGSCGLCVVAADRVYSKADLLPIHARCNCIVLPIIGDKDPGGQLNAEDLRALYKAAGTTSGRAQGGDAVGLKRVRVKTVDHGELGPVLVSADDTVLTPQEALARRRDRPNAPKGAPAVAKKLSDLVNDPSWVRGQLAQFEARLSALEARAASGESVDGPIAYHRAQVARFRRLLGQ